MFRLYLVLLLIVAACAGRDDATPSLARRAIEGPPPPSTEPRRCIVATGTASCLPAASIPAAGIAPAVADDVAPVTVVVIDDIPARLTVIDRDLGDAATRLTAQRTAAVAAATAARGAGPDSAAWSRAQLELTALDRIGNQIGDIRARLDAIAGTLAAAGAGGQTISASLATTGRLIVRTTALTTDYEQATAALR